MKSAPQKNSQYIVTSIPVFLIGLAITGACLIAGGACHEIPAWRLYSGIAFSGLIALFTGIAGVLGLIKKIPEWSIIWIAVSITGFLVMVNFASSSLDLSAFIEIIILVFSTAIMIFIFYLISNKSWQLAGLFGTGLSTALSLILFFIATNISHDKIKTGYYAIVFGSLLSVLIYFYLKNNNKIKVLLLFIFMIVNSLMILIFDKSMQKLNHESQLIYLILFSNGLLFSGIIFNYLIRAIKCIVKKAS